MPGRPDIPVAFLGLYDSPLLSVREYSCHACRSGPGPEEESDANTLILMRQGAFCRHFGRRHATADVNQAVFFSKGSTYRVSHPADCGDRGTVFAVAPRVLQDIIRELDPSVDERPGQPFAFVSGPCESTVFWRHRELVQRLEAGTESLEPFWVDVTALQIVADTLEAAFAQQGHTRRNRREGTEADHLNLAEAAKTHLAARLGERLTLDEVARAVHASPFHFARVFQLHTGVSIHRYLTLLRLRASLERLAGGEEDLTALALDLGFSSHSHFADAFRKEFGRTPSEVRKHA